MTYRCSNALYQKEVLNNAMMLQQLRAEIKKESID